ncbi:MAG TPA: class I SAM-dependent methyltransferase [Candidatus Moranbacteria bacterium]|nr:class I SAM-dependent methyltransferase [Candidatus Moranbacteria bacterium]
MNWEDAVQQLKSQKDQQELVKACFYDDPLIDAANRYYESTEWKEMRKYLPSKKGRVLDIGAGRGISSFAFARDGWDVTALEPDPSNVVGAGAIKNLAKENNLNIKIAENWGERLPFNDAGFDVVYLRQALHHAKNLAEFCSEAGRVLKSGGIFIATREHVISKKEDLSVFLEKHPLHKLYGGENAFLLSEYKKAIENSGIKLEHILNTLESNINLYPRKNKYIPKTIAKFFGSLIKYPGMLYSFIGKKI